MMVSFADITRCVSVIREAADQHHSSMTVSCALEELQLRYPLRDAAVGHVGAVHLHEYVDGLVDLTNLLERSYLIPECLNSLQVCLGSSALVKPPYRNLGKMLQLKAKRRACCQQMNVVAGKILDPPI